MSFPAGTLCHRIPKFTFLYTSSDLPAVISRARLPAGLKTGSDRRAMALHARGRLPVHSAGSVTGLHRVPFAKKRPVSIVLKFLTKGCRQSQAISARPSGNKALQGRKGFAQIIEGKYLQTHSAAKSLQNSRYSRNMPGIQAMKAQMAPAGGHVAI